MAKTFTLSVVTLALFGMPIWIMVAEDYKMQSFVAQCVPACMHAFALQMHSRLMCAVPAG